MIIESGAPPQPAAKYEGDYKQDPKLLSPPASDGFRSTGLDTSLEAVDEFCNGNIGRKVHPQVHVIPLAVHINRLNVEGPANALKGTRQFLLSPFGFLAAALIGSASVN